MGLDTQKNFAEMDEDGNMVDGIWSQVVCLNPPVKSKPKKKSEVGIPLTYAQ